MSLVRNVTCVEPTIANNATANRNDPLQFCVLGNELKIRVFDVQLIFRYVSHVWKHITRVFYVSPTAKPTFLSRNVFLAMLTTNPWPQQDDQNSLPPTPDHSKMMAIADHQPQTRARWWLRKAAGWERLLRKAAEKSCWERLRKAAEKGCWERLLRKAAEKDFIYRRDYTMIPGGSEHISSQTGRCWRADHCGSFPILFDQYPYNHIYYLI